MPSRDAATFGHHERLSARDAPEKSAKLNAHRRFHQPVLNNNACTVLVRHTATVDMRIGVTNGCDHARHARLRQRFAHAGPRILGRFAAKAPA